MSSHNLAPNGHIGTDLAGDMYRSSQFLRIGAIYGVLDDFCELSYKPCHQLWLQVKSWRSSELAQSLYPCLTNASLHELRYPTRSTFPLAPTALGGRHQPTEHLLEYTHRLGDLTYYFYLDI